MIQSPKSPYVSRTYLCQMYLAEFQSTSPTWTLWSVWNYWNNNYGSTSSPFCSSQKKKTGLPPLNNVLLVKIEGPGWYTIYHHLPVVFKGFLKNPLIFFINQPTHRIHGAGIYTNMTGLYWWDPCYHIWQHHGSYDPMGKSLGQLPPMVSCQHQCQYQRLQHHGELLLGSAARATVCRAHFLAPVMDRLPSGYLT